MKLDVFAVLTKSSGDRCPDHDLSDQAHSCVMAEEDWPTCYLSVFSPSPVTASSVTAEDSSLWQLDNLPSASFLTSLAVTQVSKAHSLEY